MACMKYPYIHSYMFDMFLQVEYVCVCTCVGEKERKYWNGGKLSTCFSASLYVCVCFVYVPGCVTSSDTCHL